jgi:hypothetical protein
MKRLTVLGMALALVSIWAVMATGGTAVWLTEEIRVVGLVTLPTAVVAALLVLYFDWRIKLQRQVLAEHDGRHDLDQAA